MKISHVVIHELEKESGKSGASLIMFDSAIDHTDKRVVKLITELNERYKNRNETYGIFDKKNPTSFHIGFDKYFSSKSLNDFIDFTKIAAQDLSARVDNIAPAKGGYLIFAKYIKLREFIGVFLVRNTTGISLTKDKNQNKFDVGNVQHIDFENLAMACRINLGSYCMSDIRYLSFINKKGDEMSKFFTRWISSIDTETNEHDTQKLYFLLKDIPSPIDPETGNEIDKYEFLDTVYSYITKTPGRLINIRTLSESFYNNPSYLPEKIEELGLEINGEFKAHAKALKKFIHVRAKADGIEIAFPHTAFKTAVKFDQRDSSQIIIKSEKLVNKIKDLINREE
jgi:nucleoid-associated protein